MICSQCKNQNPIGNKFCRECGAPLTQSVSPLAQEDITLADHERLSERVAGLLSAAFTLSEQKRFDQALPIAEEAVMLLPQSTSALSLLATLLEQTGQITRAVTVMERVVSLNPESPADRQKLDALRKKPLLPIGTATTAQMPRSATTEADSASTRRVPGWAPIVLGGGAAACVFGIWLSINNQRGMTPNVSTVAGIAGAPTPASPVAPAGEMSANVRSAAEMAAAAANTAPAAPRGGTVTTPTEATRPDPFSSLAASSAPVTIRERGSAGSSLPPLKISAGRNNRSSGNFPASSGAGADSGDPSGTLAPIIAVPPSQASNGGFGQTQSSTSPGQNAGSRTTNDQGSLEMPPGANGAPAPTPTPYIRITVGASGNSGGSSPGASNTRTAPSGGSDGGDALSRARRLQGSGRYSDAIAAYQQSLSSGSGSTGAAQQGIGQSYARLGNEPAARGAYRDAIRAFQAQSAAGHNVGAAERGIAACKAALEVLGGE